MILGEVFPPDIPFIECVRIAYRENKTLCINGDRAAMMPAPVTGWTVVYDNRRVNAELLDAYELTAATDGPCDIHELR